MHTGKFKLPDRKTSESHDPINIWNVIIIYFINWNLCWMIGFHDEMMRTFVV